MNSQAASDVTVLLHAWRNGDRSVEAKLFPVVFGELKRLARRHMAGENSGHTLQTGALVNEAYLRLVSWENAQWENRAQFFAICSRMMRQILVDHARARRSQKRGSDGYKIQFDEALSVSESDDEHLLALDDALKQLARLYPRKSDVIEMRFFGGLSVEETASILNISRMTVIRDFQFARAWLRSSISGESPDSVELNPDL